MVRVDVTSNIIGTYTNTTSTLTSSVGEHGTATDALSVGLNIPGFSKSFSPSSIPPRVPAG